MSWLDELQSDIKKRNLVKLNAIENQLDEIKKKFKIKPCKNRTEESERWMYYEKTYGYHEDVISGKKWQVDYDTGEIVELKPTTNSTGKKPKEEQNNEQ
jgi:hypothetical protein